MRKAKEEAEFNQPFRANPIPPSVLLPKYKTLSENEQRRREEVRRKSAEWTMQNLKPFSFDERDRLKKQQELLDREQNKEINPEMFVRVKANPVPAHTHERLFEKMMIQREIERKNNVTRRSQQLMELSKLPDRMQMHQENKSKEAAKQCAGISLSSINRKPFDSGH